MRSLSFLISIALFLAVFAMPSQAAEIACFDSNDYYTQGAINSPVHEPKVFWVSRAWQGDLKLIFATPELEQAYIQRVISSTPSFTQCFAGYYVNEGFGFIVHSVVSGTGKSD